MFLVLLPLLCTSAAATPFLCAGFANDTAFSEPSSSDPLAAKLATVSSTQHVRAVAIFAHFQDEVVPAQIPDYGSWMFDAEVDGSLSHYYRTMSIAPGSPE